MNKLTIIIDNQLKIFCCYSLLGLWLSPVEAVGFDSSITATAQWVGNTHDGNSQAFSLTILPEFDAHFSNGWQIKSLPSKVAW